MNFKFSLSKPVTFTKGFFNDKLFIISSLTSLVAVAVKAASFMSLPKISYKSAISL